MATEKHTEQARKGDPSVAFRVPQELKDTVLALRESVRSQDGGRGTQTDVCRAVLTAVLDPSLVGRILALRTSSGATFSDALRQVLRVGLDALEKGAR